MKAVKSIIQAVIVGSLVLMPAFVAPAALAAATEESVQKESPSTEIDMTPAEQSLEVRELLKGRNFAPDEGEPAGAIKTYIATDEKVRTALRRIRVGLLPGEVDFDPEQLLNEALSARQQATAFYPTSRHAWQGLGDLFWWKYMWRRRSSDLRNAVDAYTEASKVLTQRGSAGFGRDLAIIVRQIANALATLSDVSKLDAFFASLRGTQFWPLARHPYAVALGSLNDPRADQFFQEELLLMPPGKTLPDYVNYLWDRGRYQDALRVFDRKPTSAHWALERAMRGAILERLGRLDEARVEYEAYLQEAAKSSPWGFLDVSERYRIPGSPLQQNIKFRRDPDSLPPPQSDLPRESSARVAADQRPTGCPSEDWFCKAEWYLLWTIHGETGCVDLASTCWGTWGGQRAVAYNIRHRVFVSATTRICSGKTEVCTELYAANAPILPFWGDPVALAKRYYYVIDQGYGGVNLPMTSAESDEARFTGMAVIVNGNVPDPNVGGCMAGFAYGDVCEWGGGCTDAAGAWGTYPVRLGTLQFRAGKLANQGGPSTTCQWPELVPSSTPSAVRCGEQCFIPAMWGATCPRYDWLEKSAGCVGSDRRFWAPRRGNFYWRVFFPGASDALLLFADVPASHPFFSWIMAVVTAGIDSGCTADGAYFCPDAAITRAAMAGWLLRGIHGGSYLPPAATGMFADVSLSDPAAPWIEQLAHEGITSGCGTNPPIYCPNAEVTRGQMAVFLLRATYGATYQPPPVTGLFTDVPVNHPFARWIEQVANEGITSGCSVSPAQYCPNATVPRGQMAVFVARTFNLPM